MVWLTCPKCGRKIRLRAPKHVCLQGINCSHCNEKIKCPRGECCVICAYSKTKCPAHKHAFPRRKQP